MTQAPTSEERVLEALARAPSFAQLDDKSRRKLARLCTLQSYAAGDVLYEEGAVGLGMFIVVSGRVERSKGSGDGRVELGTVTAGGILGQLALIDEQPRSAGAAATEPTECLLLTRDRFATLVKKEPQIAWCLTPELAGRIRELQARAMEEALKPRTAPAGAAPSAGEPDAAAAQAEAATEAADEDEAEDEEEGSELESAFVKMMRIQFGMMAGAARCMTESARVMEAFLDSMADETELKSSDEWRDMMGKMPDAMVTATREAMDRCEKVPGKMMDAFRRYADEE